MRGRRKSESTRLAILRCASTVFSERPYHEVLTDEISARLGVGKGTLYRYFPSKEELYFATIVHGLQGMRSAIAEVVAPGQPLERIIEDLTRTVIGYFWQRRDFFVLLHRHEPKLDASERADWQQQRQEVVDLVAARLAEEMKERGVARLDARLAVEMLFGMIRSVCMYRRESDRIDDLTGQVTQVFLRGVLAAERPDSRERAAPSRRLRALSRSGR